VTLYDIFCFGNQIALLFTDGKLSIVLSPDHTQEWIKPKGFYLNHHLRALERQGEFKRVLECRENLEGLPNYLFGLGLGTERKDHKAHTPFLHIGGPEQRLTPTITLPNQVVCPDEDRRYFLHGYIAGAVLHYGVDWRTVKIEE
jgi:hypothetical protein